MIPTRWRTAIADQLADARQRSVRAEQYFQSDDGSRALQEAYPAVVAAATVRVWLEHPPWRHPLAPQDLQARVREAFPSLFAALASLDLQQVLTSPWRPSDAEPYVTEARKYVAETEGQVEAWLAQA